ncbi:MAG: putative DNA binding domain-containing protein [Candidatus Competibacteraceae bacterium]|nr:putative DNA binding domain-containing protein [Candidatus Competibacteraceae bacterium]MCB1808913.1 putative DNA binding domain-containing protein [Candidatus Competibacteraceae bacterium]
MTPEELLLRLDVGEDQDTEFKLAEGGLPKSLWETVSAFANTKGGIIILGIEEQGANFKVSGVRKPETLLKTFWDGHNNSQKLSTPICSDADVHIVRIADHKLVVINVPRARRIQRPLYINGNPMMGTFKRNHEGDYRCSEPEIRQMLRDAGDEPQDLRILEGFGWDDLDSEAIKAYRNRFSSRTPNHPFLALDHIGLLQRLGGWSRDRSTGKEGLTLAGLLMFGRERSLLDELPHYHLDYQEQLSADPEVRWTYRITLDGTWEPNLFNFYYRVYPRLVADISVPFKLDKDSTRQDETHVHEALREALVNTLIHADHQSSLPLVISKQRNAFIFKNPGRLRIPREELYQGGVSDPRNPNLQKMFQMLGLGEKAGSGFQKILRAWHEQHWLRPLVDEPSTLEMTRIYLPVMSMIPDAVEYELRQLVGDQYTELHELDRIILMLAQRLGAIGNENIQLYRREHPREIGEHLRRLVNQGWLDKSGHGRGTRYRLPTSTQTDLFGETLPSPPLSLRHNGGSEHYSPNSEHYDANSEHYSSEHYQQLQKLAVPVREKGRVSKELVEKTIVALCAKDWLTLRTLAHLLNREPDTLRNHYINPMLRAGRLAARFPDQTNHPGQAYKAKQVLPQ